MLPNDPTDLSPETSSLDSLETNAQDLNDTASWGDQDLVPDLGVAFRHSRWQRHRYAVYAAMSAAHLPAARLERFAWCGCRAWVVQSVMNPDDVRIASSHCHDRFCTPCATERARLIAGNALKWIANREVRMITLTIQHSELPLTEQIDHLFRSFRRLRNAARWKSHVTGGVAFLEIKVSKDRRHWHPHLHIVAEGTYYPHASLADDWHRITGTSYVVHITKPRKGDAGARYCAKYAGKPMSFGYTNQPAKMTEALTALRSRRLMTTFGTWRGCKLTERPEPDETQPLVPLHDLLTRARSGDPWAVSLLGRLARNGSCPPRPLELLSLFPRTPRSPPSSAQDIGATVPAVAAS